MLGVVVLYTLLAGAEALMAGSIVGLLYVSPTIMYILPNADDSNDQTRRCLQGWEFPDVNLDPLHLGCD